MTYRDGNGEVYVMDSNGANQINLTNSPGTLDIQPAWSPDGTKIAFERGTGSLSQIYIMNANGSNQVRLSDGPYDYVPEWSPDGTKIAFTRLQDDISDIYVMNPDGSNPVRLTNHSDDDSVPNWGIPVFGTPSPTPTATPTATVTGTPGGPTLGNYSNTSISLSTDTTVAPDAPPTNTTNINVSTS